MAPDEEPTSHSHGFELPDAPQVVVRKDTRPWRAVAGVALCLGLAGIVTGLIVAHRQRVSDEHLTSDALQREELRDGWKALGAAAAHDAQADGAPAPAAANAPSAAPNVVIVNVPTQAAPAAQPNVTNINMPNGAPGAPSGSQTANSNVNTGNPTGQGTPVDFSPMQGYVPAPAGYGSAAAGDTPRPVYSPQTSYGTTTGNGAAPVTPPVGNGSIPGSSPNPALPNNGLVGSSPAPGLPNGSVNGSSPTPSLPSGSSIPSIP